MSFCNSQSGNRKRIRLAPRVRVAVGGRSAIMSTSTPSNEPQLRYWLLNSARLDNRIIDRTVDALTNEDVFSVADLHSLNRVGRLEQLFTAVTSDKIAQALYAEALSKGPTGREDGSVPNWLSEAEGELALLKSTSGGFELSLPQAAPANGKAKQQIRPLDTKTLDDDMYEEEGSTTSERSSRGRRRGRRQRRSQSQRAPLNRNEGDEGEARSDRADWRTGRGKERTGRAEERRGRAEERNKHPPQTATARADTEIIWGGGEAAVDLSDPTSNAASSASAAPAASAAAPAADAATSRAVACREARRGGGRRAANRHGAATAISAGRQRPARATRGRVSRAVQNARRSSWHGESSWMEWRRSHRAAMTRRGEGVASSSRNSEAAAILLAGARRGGTGA